MMMVDNKDLGNILSLNQLIAGIQLTSPLGVQYTVIDSNAVSFVHSAAFSLFLSSPVLQVDTHLVVEQLVIVWKTFKSGKSRG